MREIPLTILQLTFQGDGAGSTQSILNLSEQLTRRGHRVLVGCRAESLLARLAADAGGGLAVVPLDFTRLGDLARTLARTLAHERVQVVNSHATQDRRALTWLRWRGKLPQAFVVTRRTMPLTSPFELFTVGHVADRTIAVSGAVARALGSRWHPTARLRVVPNGLDVARMDASLPAGDLDAARAALGEIGDRQVIVVIARRKDQHVLLAALPAVEPPVLLACVGVEPDTELTGLAAALPPRHRTVFVPFVPRPIAFYHLAAAAALPSRIEGLSQSLLEAMALGLPVVASHAGGNPDLLTDEITGLLVAPLDSGAWAQALTRILSERELAQDIARRGRDLVRREFTLERTAQRTEIVYREALERRPRLLHRDHPV
jgi:glycosyltransferase involved in cell wall biosynthesis